MKITFFGTSHGIPEKDRFCSSAAVTVNGFTYIIDAGVSLFSMLRHHDMPIENVRGVFITHNHGDHTTGLAEFIHMVGWAYRNMKQPSIFMPNRAAAFAIQTWTNMMENGHVPVEISVIEEGLIYEDENVKVSAIKTMHAEPSYAFVIEAEGKRVVFTGDLKRDMSDYPAIIFEEYCDAVVCECTHNRLSESADILNRSKTGFIIFNHVYPGRSQDEYDKYSPSAPFKTVIAKDDDVFEI